MYAYTKTVLIRVIRAPKKGVDAYFYTSTLFDYAPYYTALWTLLRNATKPITSAHAPY